MTVSHIGWGRFFDKWGNKVTVPAPSTDPGKPWLWDLLAAEAQNLASVGFDRIQLPPASKAQGGDGAGCDGYGIYDPRDLGTKNQQGSIPTRYGTADSLRRLVAVAHRCGLAVDLAWRTAIVRWVVACIVSRSLKGSICWWSGRAGAGRSAGC